MTDERKAQVRDIVAAFRDKPVSNEALKSYCERNNYLILTKGEYEDYLYQIKHDEKMAAVYPKLLSALAALRYTPLFASEAERKADETARDEVRVHLAADEVRMVEQPLEEGDVGLDPLDHELVEAAPQPADRGRPILGVGNARDRQNPAGRQGPGHAPTVFHKAQGNPRHTRSHTHWAAARPQPDRLHTSL